MFRLSPRRNQRNKGFKVKHVVQIGILLGVFIWLLYQVQHSRNKESLTEENNSVTGKLQDGNNIIKLGRKDIQPGLKGTSSEDEANVEEQEEEPKQFHDDIKAGENGHDEDRGEEGEDKGGFEEKDIDEGAGKEKTEDEIEERERRDDGGENEKNVNDDRGTFVDGEEKTDEGTRKEVTNGENEDKDSNKEGENEKENENDRNKNEVAETKEEEVGKGEEEQISEKGEEDKEKEHTKNESEENHNDVAKGESNANGVEDSEDKQSGETDVEEKNANNDKGENKELGSEKAKQNESELDGGDEKEAIQAEKKDSEDSAKNGESSLQKVEKYISNEGVGTQGDKTDENDGSKENTLDIPNGVVKDSEKSIETNKNGLLNSNVEEKPSENEQNGVPLKDKDNVEEHTVKKDASGEGEKSSDTSLDSRNETQVESGGTSNFTGSNTVANEQKVDDNSSSSGNVEEKSGSHEIPLMTVDNSVNLQSADDQNTNPNTTGRVDHGSENASETEKNDTVEEHKSSANSETVIQQKINPSNDNDNSDSSQDKSEHSSNNDENSSGNEKTDSVTDQKSDGNSERVTEQQVNPSNDNDETSQSKPEDSSHSEEVSTVSYENGDPGQQNQGGSSDSSIPEEEKEAHINLPESGTEGNNHDETAAE